MRENRPYGSEGGEAKSLPYPYRGWVRLNVQNDGSNSASCVHRIHPASVTTAKRPSVGRDGDGYTSDLGQTRSGIFLQPGLDRFLPDGQISRACAMGSELLTCCGVVAGANREVRANC